MQEHGVLRTYSRGRVSTKKKILLMLCLVSVLAGGIAGLLPGASRAQGLMEYALSIAMIVGIYVWCRTDLTLQAPRRSSRWALWSALFPPIVVPAYLFRTRPLARALWSLAQGVGAYIGLTLLFVLVAVGVSVAGAA
jgi:hypothetical protein